MSGLYHNTISAARSYSVYLITENSERRFYFAVCFRRLLLSCSSNTITLDVLTRECFSLKWLGVCLWSIVRGSSLPIFASVLLPRFKRVFSSTTRTFTSQYLSSYSFYRPEVSSSFLTLWIGHCNCTYQEKALSLNLLISCNERRSRSCLVHQVGP